MTSKTSTSLICPCCKERVDELVTPSYCRTCWYPVAGGDLALDWVLYLAPMVWLS